MRWSRKLAGGAFAALVLSHSAAAEDAWLLSAGGDIDDESGYRLQLGLNWSPSEATLVTLLGARADTATDFGDYTSTVAVLGLDHFFGPVGFTAQVRRSDESGLLMAHTLAGSVYLQRGGWRFAVHGESRSSEFDAFDFSTTIPVRTLQGLLTVPLSGRAECELDNTGFGATVSRSSGAWLFALGATGYDYSNNDCDISNVVLPPQLTEVPVLSREAFRRVAAHAIDLTGRLIGSQVTRGNGLLDTAISAGLQYQSGVRTWGLDYYHDSEEFAGLDSTTLVGSMVFPVGGYTDMELRLGATDGEAGGTVGFAGVMFFVYIGGGA